MNRFKFSNNTKVYLGLVAVGLIMYLLYPSKATFQYSYQIGSPWKYETLVAPFDFPLLKTDEQLLIEKEKKAAQIIDYYNFEDKVAKDVFDEMEKSVRKSSLKNDTVSSVISIVSRTLDGIYESGLIAKKEGDSDKVIFIKKDKRAKETPIAELYSIDEAYNTIVDNVSIKYGKIADSICNELNIKRLLVPNLIFDEKTTNTLHREAVEYISPTMGTIYTGQLIISSGEIVTAELYQLLDSYKSEYIKSYGLSDLNGRYKIGIILTIIMILILLYLNIYFTDNSILSDKRKMSFILLLFVINYLAVAILINVNSNLLYLLPLPLIVLYTQAFFKPSFVFPNYIIFLLPLLLIPEDGLKLFIINLAGGGILLRSFSIMNRGWRQFLNILFVFAAYIAAYHAFSLRSNLALYRLDIIFLAINAFLVVICYPIVYLFEKAFSFVSSTKLWELSDTNNRILRELSQKAPGTFQHSLQVASLAEDACRKIDANPALVKVGALYHDIGKMLNPTCFIENHSSVGGNDYHKLLTPKESAEVIIKHISDGYDLAKREFLPDIIADFIISHHGTSVTGYFYNQYCNAGGDPADIASFTYNGKLPSTKEEAVLMLADSVEAATRSLKEHNEENIKNTVSQVIKKKMDDGQLTSANITLKEIETVRDSFVSYLLQIYHDRISYPELNKAKKKVTFINR